MHTTRRSRKYRKKSKQTGGPKFTPTLAGRQRAEREGQLESLRVVLAKPDDWDPQENEDFE